MTHLLVTVFESLPYVLGGVPLTVMIVVGSMGIGLGLGVLLAVGQVYGDAIARFLAGFYVWYFRGVPILVNFLLFYFGLFPLLGLNLDAATSATLVLGLDSAAYQSQIFRGSILALSRGQFRAASALGMSNGQAIRNIVLPQALRLSLPGWSNEYSIKLKDSALVFVLGATDVMARTHFVGSRTYEHLAFYVVAALIYFVLTLIGIRLLRMLERRVAIRGYGRA